MFVQTSSTPNPATMKFLFQDQVVSNTTLVFSANKPEEYEGKSVLMSLIFESKDVKSIFCGRDFMTITKTEDAQWNLLKPELLAIIVDHFSAGGGVLDSKEELESEEVIGKSIGSNDILETDDDIVVEIKTLLEEKVTPAVAQDGGEIIFHNFEDGIVYLEMHGSCSGCPSASITLKNGIENMLKHYIPEVVSVSAVEV